MSAQSKKIEIAKWCEGVGRCSDPGGDFVLSWIRDHGKWFRDAWDTSLCKNCQLAGECGHEVRKACIEFTALEGE